MLLTQEPREFNVALKFYESGKLTMLERQQLRNDNKYISLFRNLRYPR